MPLGQEFASTCLQGVDASSSVDRFWRTRVMESKDTLTGLRANCLGFSGVTAMAIALISPTMTAALIIPLM
jgi:hypothetical protein